MIKDESLIHVHKAGNNLKSRDKAGFMAIKARVVGLQKARLGRCPPLCDQGESKVGIRDESKKSMTITYVSMWL